MARGTHGVLPFFLLAQLAAKLFAARRVTTFAAIGNRVPRSAQIEEALPGGR